MSRKSKIFRAIFYTLAGLCLAIAFIYVFASLTATTDSICTFLLGIGIAVAAFIVFGIFMKIAIFFDTKIKKAEAAIAEAREDALLWEAAGIRVRNDLKKYTSR